jgi:membrane protein required for colicin V production
MTPSADAANGSTLWQTVFVSFAVVLVLFEIIRGWRLGFMRQLVRIVAVIVAYASAVFGGRLLVPVFRPFLRAPDIVVTMVAGAILAILLYSIVTNLGRLLFKRTSQYVSPPIRLCCGAGGAAVGFIFGVFLIWMVVFGVRSVGAIAAGHFHSPNTAASQAVHAVYSPNADATTKKAEPRALLTLLARLKNSVELGSVGEVVKRSDFVSPTTYDTLEKVGAVVSNADAAERFLKFPGVHELTQNPKIIALREDRHISDLIAQGRFVDLLQDDKILDTVNDAALAQQVRKFDFKGALDYALKK